MLCEVDVLPLDLNIFIQYYFILFPHNISEKYCAILLTASVISYLSDYYFTINTVTVLELLTHISL